MTQRAVQFRAWCNGVPCGNNYGLNWAHTWHEAEQAVAPLTKHKAFVAIERCDISMRHVRFYTVKKSTTKFNARQAYDGAYTVREGRLELVQAGGMEMESFEPRRPFDALCDSPVSGAQPGDPVVIER
jgi:hypothetical protein